MAKPAPAQDTANAYARKSLQAMRIAGVKPTIDGQLDESVWSMAPAGTGFTQVRPNPGQPSGQETEVRVAFDDDALYVGLRMYDTRPDSVVAQLARRDQGIYSDWIYVALDSYYDRRTGFVFGVNPKGVKIDVLLFDDTREDESWDAVWDVAARQDSAGWTAEFRIPLSQLRYSTKDMEGSIVWGLNILRKIARSDEESFWSPVRRDQDVMVSAFGDLRGLQGLKSARRVEIVPYSMSRLIHAPGDKANPFYQSNEAALGAGADVKFGLTSDLTVTATINPDFGQVEADPSVVNLTAYETFFPEKRPFFVEGFDIFRAGIGVGDGDSGNESLFYSRRIGRSPQGSAPDEAEYVDAPQSATILGAAKLSGKTRNGWSIGTLTALTARETAAYFDENDRRGEVVVEPMTHYGVARVTKDFRGGQSAVGGVFTTVNRDLPSELNHLRSNAFAGGMTARHRWRNGTYQLSGFLVGSHVTGDTAAINQTQRSSARFFNRPDNDHTDYDPTRTSLSGYAGGFEFFKTGGGHWRYAAALNARSPGFEVNDLGYMQNADQILQVAYVGYDQYKPTKHFRRWNVNVNQWTGWNFGGDNNSFAGNINGSAEFHNAWDIWYSINRDQPRLSESALRGGPAMRLPGGTGFNVGFDSDERKAFNYWVSFNYYAEDETDGRSIGIYPGTRWRLGNRAELRLTPSVSLNRRSAQYIDNIDVSGNSTYLFGTLEQVTTSLTTRLSYTFTPNLSLQVYAEPFISAGDYEGFMQVADPRAGSFADRFVAYNAAEIQHDANENQYTVNHDGAQFTFDNPDFNFRALRSNAVLRWEYRPGSALFLVWSQGREAFSEYGDYDMRRDAGRLFGSKATNVLLIKATYWLGL
ncbi:MAG TPA: DUF5916 domain-containing protein [Longimicrobiales bacterium]